MPLTSAPPSTTRRGRRPAPGGYDGTLGQGVEALWYDTYLHGDDVRAALGLPSLRGSGLRASVHHVAHELGKRGWGPATLAFDGIEEVPVGAGGTKHTGDALEFVLVATGRADPAALGPDGPLDIYAPRAPESRCVGASACRRGSRVGLQRRRPPRRWPREKANPANQNTKKTAATIHRQVDGEPDAGEDHGASSRKTTTRHPMADAGVGAGSVPPELGERPG